MLTVAILACLCGADNCCKIEHWAKTRLDWLRQFLPLKYGIASHDTYSLVLASIDTKQFAQSFTTWTYHLIPTLQNQGVVAIDGKLLVEPRAKILDPCIL